MKKTISSWLLVGLFLTSCQPEKADKSSPRCENEMEKQSPVQKIAEEKAPESVAPVAKTEEGSSVDLTQNLSVSMELEEQLAKVTIEDAPLMSLISDMVADLSLKTEENVALTVEN